MKEEMLLDALNAVGEDLLEEADKAREKAKHRRRIRVFPVAAAAACLVLVLGFAAARSGLFSKTPTNATNEAFMADAGPVLALGAENGEGLEIKRQVEFDFSPYEGQIERYTDGNGTVQEYRRIRQAAVVRDSYALSNTADEEKTYDFSYPFIAELYDEADLLPVLTLDGQALTAQWDIGESTEMPDLALQRATVYELSSLYGAGTQTQNPRLYISFTADPENAKVYSYGFQAASVYEGGRYEFGVSIPQEDASESEKTAYVVVLGEDIPAYEICGYTSGGKETVLPDAGCQVTRTETTLGEALTMLLKTQDYPMLAKAREKEELHALLAPEDFAALVCDFLSDLSEDRLDALLLEDVFTQIRALRREMKLRFTLTIPAGKTVILSAQMVKNASCHYGGAGEDTTKNGYSLASSAQSSMQTVRLRNTESIELLSNDFGFDENEGILEATLDGEKTEYFLVLKVKQEG